MWIFLKFSLKAFKMPNYLDFDCILGAKKCVPRSLESLREVDLFAMKATFFGNLAIISLEKNTLNYLVSNFPTFWLIRLIVTVKSIGL